MNEPAKESKFELVKTIIFAGLIALAFRSLFFEPFNIPSGSMRPTLLVGDYLFVSKFSYGYSRYSFPLGIISFDGRIMGAAPERGDVAVFRQPTDDKVDFIKRVIGLPGDRIQVRAGVLYINDKPVERRLIGRARSSDGFTVLDFQIYEETLPNGKTHVIQERSDNDSFDNTVVYTVPEGHYFMMGDNRDNSRDSRTTAVGMVPAANLIGRADRLFFSHNGTSKFWEIWKWPFAIRYSRLGDGIN